ncbi:hypothetical protein [Aestuariibaculum sediminum]|uniref:Uncharacterized protein n=1 Tax=Aestuariibaculum sediminum TaxID=2770637 RepID=A0A8J6Q6C6_9FLAO|nr:hypothetical protein [Aestuariibaculum sediminum]MBD0831708.1 hypothetical protein [Aestuariibaculum sediminum]
MRQTLTIFAVIASVFTIIFSVLPISNLAIFPGIAALLLAGGAFYLSKKSGEVKKLIPFSFILTTLALLLTFYKAIFTTTEVEDTQALETKEIQFEEAAIEELESLDLEIDESELKELEDIEIDASEIEEIEIDASEIESINIDDAEIESLEINENDIIETEIESSDLENLEIN